MSEREGTMLALLRHLEQEGIGEENIRRNEVYHRAMGQSYRSAGRPQSGVLELTPYCNLDCKMCYVHLRPEQMEGRKLIGADRWVDWIDEAIELGMQTVQLTGGEAMLHPEFDRIYLHLIERGIWVTVMTNGILLNEERIAFFKCHRPSSVQVTMYGGSEEGYERVTGHRHFELVKKHLLAAKEIGCRLVATMTPSRYFGKEDALAVQRFAHENGIQLVINNDLNEPREDTGRSLSAFNLDLEEYLEIQKALRAKTSETVPLETLPQSGENQESCIGLKCGAGRSMFCITWEGEMKACFDLPMAVSLKETALKEAWQQINEQAEAFLIPCECLDCQYREVCNLCPAIHALNAPAGHADRRICERTRRLVSQGLVRRPAGMAF